MKNIITKMNDTCRKTQNFIFEKILLYYDKIWFLDFGIYIYKICETKL